MKKFIIGVVVCILTVGGCAFSTKHPTVEEINSANYGAAPENPKEQAMAYIQETFFDPMSAVVEWQGECEKGWWRVIESASMLVPPKVYFGWKIKAKVNAKNRMGGYVGFKDMEFCFQDGKLVKVFS